MGCVHRHLSSVPGSCVDPRVEASKLSQLWRPNGRTSGGKGVSTQQLVGSGRIGSWLPVGVSIGFGLGFGRTIGCPQSRIANAFGGLSAFATGRLSFEPPL